MTLQSFVIEQDQHAGTTRVYAYGQDSKAAIAYYNRRENELFPWPDSAPRVCMFSAYSLDDLRYTHANWFYADTQVIEGAA